MRFRGWIRAAAILALLAATSASAQRATVRPVDQAASDPSFAAFRARLIRAVEARDTAFLYAALAPDILNSFGGDGGAAEFKHTWEPGRRDSELWPTLADLLRLGGEFMGDSMFTAPYVHTARHPELCEWECGVVIGRGVRVRARPDARGPVIATLSYHVVRVRDWGGSPLSPDAWARIALPGGRAGYVSRRWVRSPTDHRAVFVRRGGRWYLNVLVAGD